MCMANGREKAVICGRMAALTPGTGIKTLFMASGSIAGPTAAYTRDSGKTTAQKGKDHSPGKTADNTSVLKHKLLFI